MQSKCNIIGGNDAEIFPGLTLFTE